MALETVGHFQVERIPGTKRANVYRDGEYRCQLIVGRELNTWLFQYNRSIDEEIAYEPRRRQLRLETVREYLAKRALRPRAAVQMALF